jgi:hypothetical protein
MDCVQRRDFLIAAGALLAAPLAAEAQQAVSIARIGYLNPSLANASSLEALRQGLRNLGYNEGRNDLGLTIPQSVMARADEVIH